MEYSRLLTLLGVLNIKEEGNWMRIEGEGGLRVTACTYKLGCLLNRDGCHCHSSAVRQSQLFPIRVSLYLKIGLVRESRYSISGIFDCAISHLITL